MKKWPIKLIKRRPMKSDSDPAKGAIEAVAMKFARTIHVEDVPEVPSYERYASVSFVAEDEGYEETESPLR